MADKQQGSIFIFRNDGTTYDLESEGIRVISFDPPSANFQHTYNQTGDYGTELVNTQVQQLTIPIIFDVTALDNYDYELQRLKVLRIFSSTEPFYVVNMRIPWLRWKVVAEAFSYSRLNNYWKAKSVSVNLVCPDGLAESTATTLDPFTFDSNSYGIGMGLSFDAYKYSFTNKKRFNIHNPSIIPLLASERPVVINFKGTAPNGITITNHTTNQSFNFKRSLTRSDEFKLIGLVPIVNGTQRFGNDWSDRGFVDYAIGDNDIEVTGSDDFDISFKTRFYY